MPTTLRRDRREDIDPPNMSVPEVAAYIGVSRQHVYTMIREGRLRAYRLGRVVRLRHSEVDAALGITV